MDGDTLVDNAKLLANREGFVAFVESLRQNLTEHPDEWENQSLDSFLGALGLFCKNSDGYYANIGEMDFDTDKPSWRGFADMLLAAKVYE